MTEVYVYKPQGNVAFNSYIYAFMRSWYTLDGTEDKWFKIPAYRVPGTDKFTCINSKVQPVSVMILGENGQVLKMKNDKMRKQTIIDTATLDSIEREAINTSEWERENQKTFPFAEMFEDENIKRRYREKFGHENPAYDKIQNQNFRVVRRTISPPARCGSCGGRRR